MNAAARALTQGTFTSFNVSSLTLSSQTIGIILLIIAVLSSALSVVYVKNLNRQLFCELHTLKQTRDELHIESDRLSLEQNTWASSTRVQTIAQQQLNMTQPTSKDVVLVTLPIRQ